MSQQAFPITNFQYPDGAPVANGYVDIRLSVDGSVNSSQVERIFTRSTLNSSGNLVGPVFWPNSSILPSGSYYIINVYNSQGQLVAGPNKVTI
jgi:hypothetical protein